MVQMKSTLHIQYAPIFDDDEEEAAVAVVVVVR